MPAASDIGAILLSCVIAAGFALLVGLVVTLGLRWFGKRNQLDVEWTRIWRSPIVLLFVVMAVRDVLSRSGSDEGWAEAVIRFLDIAGILAIGWILLTVVEVLETAALRRYPETGLRDRRSRHERTKISLVRKVTEAVIVTGAVGAILWMIPAVRQFGVGLLASAGVVGIVFGLAAQTSLANIFAGIQIAFSDAIRIDDVVQIDGELGRIEHITLTYVVVRIWDGTSLILPCTYFTTTPFRNWTHQGTEILGVVEIGVAGREPVAPLREELARILAVSPYWDGRVGELHVAEASEVRVSIVAIVSAADSDMLTRLRWEVREQLVAFLDRRRQERAEVTAR